MGFPKCDDCGHRFDAADKRGHVSATMRLCPLCNALLMAHTEWAIKNDCNGVFETRPRRADAQKLLESGGYHNVDARVVPVKVIELTNDFDVFVASNRESEIERTGV